MTHRKRRCQRGNALIELALSATLLFALCMGTTDFARIFLHSIVLTDSAGAGLTFGTLRLAHSGRYSQISTIEQEASSDVSGLATVTPVVERYCDCPDSPAEGPSDANAIDCITGSCPGYGSPRVYVRTKSKQLFWTFGKYPLMTQEQEIGPVVYRRAQ